MKTSTLIEGGGLSGLHAANLLEEAEQDCVLVEGGAGFVGQIRTAHLQDTPIELDGQIRKSGVGAKIG